MDTKKPDGSTKMPSSSAAEVFAGVPKPEKIIEAVRKYVRGAGREKEEGRSGIRAVINFYRDYPERAKVVEFLKRVLKEVK
jgi:hypothetical protein